jgi:DNA-binding beta-propeller fold protein YncE
LVTFLPKTTGESGRDATVGGRLFSLELGGRILSANPDGSRVAVIVQEGRDLPDGLAVDAAAGHLYWTNMGNPKANDGTILRCNLDGSKVTTIVPSGGAFTPKQLQLDKVGRKLYF